MTEMESAERQPLQRIQTASPAANVNANSTVSSGQYSDNELMKLGANLRKRDREQAGLPASNNAAPTTTNAQAADSTMAKDQQDRNVKPKLNPVDPKLAQLQGSTPEEVQRMFAIWKTHRQSGEEGEEEVFHDNLPENEPPVSSHPRINTRRQVHMSNRKATDTKSVARKAESKYPVYKKNEPATRGGPVASNTRYATAGRMRARQGTGVKKPTATSRKTATAPVRGVPAIRAQLGEAEKQVETLQAYLSQERNTSENLQSSLQEETKKNDDLQDMVAALKNLLVKRDGEITENERKVNETSTRLATLEEQQQELQKKLRQANIECDSQKSLNSTMQEESITLNVKLRSLESRLEREEVEYKNEMSTAKATFEREFMTQKSTYEVQIDDMKQRHDREVRQLREETSRNMMSIKDETNGEIHNLKKQYDTLKIDLNYSETSRNQLRERLDTLEKQLHEANENNKALEEKRHKDELYRRKLHNAIQELKGNIRVYCRVRPLLGKEIPSDASATPDAQIKAIKHINYTDDVDESGIDIFGETTISALGNESVKKHSFQFDRVFKPDTTQDNVFGEISQLVQSALDGYKVCIFAYGQTGSGKTFTMEGKGIKDGGGNSGHRGMIPRSVEQIFATARDMREQGWEYTIEASFLEIYNETLRDLLVSDAQIARAQAAQQDQGGQSSKTNNLPSLTLEIKHDASNGTTVQGLSTVKVNRPEQIYELLRIASKNRKVAATQCNERSSRSHSVFMLKITGRNEATQQVSNGVLNLIDLAGSERLNSSKSSGERMRETKFINSSLSCLGDVIHALGAKSKHVPFRNSKLTYLLQNSLGGDSKTLMFVNVSPLQQNVNESICSLRFAAKVNACEIGTAKRKIDSSTLSLLNKSTSSK